MFPPLVLTGAHVRLEPLGLGHVPALAAAASGARETYAYTWSTSAGPKARLSARIGHGNEHER